MAGPPSKVCAASAVAASTAQQRNFIYLHDRLRAGRAPHVRMWITCQAIESPPFPEMASACEVIAAGIEVLEACARLEKGFQLQFETFDWGSDYYKRHGVMMPADGLATLRGFDAIYFGAVGAPDVPDHITLWGLRLAICQPFDQYANVRPARLLPGIQSPLARRRARKISIGSSCARIPRANTPATAGARIAAFPRRSLPMWPSTRAPASHASCASPSIWRVRGRAAGLPW